MIVACLICILILIGSQTVRGKVAAHRACSIQILHKSDDKVLDRDHITHCCECNTRQRGVIEHSDRTRPAQMLTSLLFVVVDDAHSLHSNLVFIA